MKSIIKSKKGQIWAIDAVVALTLFIGIVLLFYRFAISFTPDYSQVNNLIKEGSYVGNTLLGPGYPSDWYLKDDLDDIYSIGLVDDNKFLNISKVDRFRFWVGDPDTNPSNYVALKSKINTRYNYYITFWNGTNFNIDSIGWDFQEQGAKQVVKIQRLVLYNDTTVIGGGQLMPVKLNLYLWTNESA